MHARDFCLHKELVISLICNKLDSYQNFNNCNIPYLFLLYKAILLSVMMPKTRNTIQQTKTQLDC